MRVTQNSSINPYLRTLNDIQQRKNEDQIRLNTGKDILSISDDPKRTANIKELNNLMSKNKVYQSNLDMGINELKAVSEQFDTMTERISNLSNVAISATTGDASTISTLSVQVKGTLEDLVKDANMEFNGKYVFSGTKTTSESLSPTSPEKENLPFEIIQGDATSDNPSGLYVTFKGNNNDRTVSKDSKTTEVINSKADDLFGKDGVELFNSVIKLYNVLKYNSDGTVRTGNSTINNNDVNKIISAKNSMEQFNEQITNVSGKNGTKINRLQSISEQITNEKIHLDDMLSTQQDTDYAAVSLNYSREQNALQYTLQTGSKIIQQSLLDFLS